jgi:diaminopimelate epimerase
LKLSFFKYQGSGNDFILIDDRSCFFPVQDEKMIRFLCSRNFGVGADGLILLQASTSADFRMRIFNSDGLEADFCGNGIRCLVLYLKDLGFQEDAFLIETQQSIAACSIQGNTVTAELPHPKVLHWGVKVEEHEAFVVNTGVPHAVIFVEDLEEVPVASIAPIIRFHPHFGSDGVNVNFVKVGADGTLRMRTYERGIEGETLACGSGAAAAALVASQKEGLPLPIRVMTKSGDTLEFSILELAEGKKVEMQGNACFVFEGCIEV